MKAKSLLGLIGLIGVVALVPAATQAQENAEEESKFSYTVENGKVDEGTMMGFTVYTGSCMACHGPDGLGSSFAPSLIRAAERRTFAQFAQTIAEGRSLQPGMVMPSFGEDMRVMSHLEDIWNYLGARAEGELGRGRPQLLEEQEDDDG